MRTTERQTHIKLGGNAAEVLEMLDLAEELYGRLVDYYTPSGLDRATALKCDTEQCDKFSGILFPIFDQLRDEFGRLMDSYLSRPDRKEAEL